MDNKELCASKFISEPIDGKKFLKNFRKATKSLKKMEKKEAKRKKKLLKKYDPSLIELADRLIKEQNTDFYPWETSIPKIPEPEPMPKEYDLWGIYSKCFIPEEACVIFNASEKPQKETSDPTGGESHQ